jgi:MFS superfamily sulfate permease-like transporter
VLDRVAAEGKSLRLVVCDLSTSPTVDLAGAKMFLELHAGLAKQGIILRLVEAHASVRDLLRLEGAEDRVGRIDRFESVADVIEHFQKRGRANMSIVAVWRYSAMGGAYYAPSESR